MPSMTLSSQRRNGRREAFTLIELLVVISIISLLISILLPSLGRAREQAKQVHCLARLKEYGNALAAYENVSQGVLPPAKWFPDERDLELPESQTGGPSLDKAIAYGWAEILFAYVYSEHVRQPVDYPVQRGVEWQKWERYLECQAVGDPGQSSGHYRVYLPAWAAGNVALGSRGIWTEESRSEPLRSGQREHVRPKLPLIGDANPRSERGDGLGEDDCSFIDAGEANYAGSDGAYNGNRFSDRHHGGTNFLFGDLHGAWNTRLRDELARDYDLNGVVDIAESP